MSIGNDNRPVQWGNFDARFCDELVAWLNGRSVLEVFGGNGLLASMLHKRGADIISTSIFSGHDGSAHGMLFDVIESDAVSAVRKYGGRCDVLLMCWPVVSPHALLAAREWGRERDIVYIGEVTDRSLGMMGLGGCACDEFFEETSETFVFNHYTPRNMLDRAAVRRLS